MAGTADIDVGSNVTLSFSAMAELSCRAENGERTLDAFVELTTDWTVLDVLKVHSLNATLAVIFNEVNGSYALTGTMEGELYFAAGGLEDAFRAKA